MFTFGENPTPFDGLSGPEAMEVFRAVNSEALSNQQKLVDALPLDELPKNGQGTPAAMDTLPDAHIAQIIDMLPQSDLSGEQVREILEALPTADMSGRQVYHALVVLQIHNVAGMGIFQGSRIAAPGTPPANNLYNISVYDRGALTLHALRVKIGDEIWFEIMRTYYDRYKAGHADTTDFIEVAEKN